MVQASKAGIRDGFKCRLHNLQKSAVVLSARASMIVPILWKISLQKLGLMKVPLVMLLVAEQKWSLILRHCLLLSDLQPCTTFREFPIPRHVSGNCWAKSCEDTLNYTQHGTPEKREAIYVYLANIYATQSLVAHKIHFNEAVLKFPTIPKLLKTNFTIMAVHKNVVSYQIQRHGVSGMPPKSYSCSSIESERGTFSWPQDLAQTKIWKVSWSKMVGFPSFGSSLACRPACSLIFPSSP